MVSTRSSSVRAESVDPDLSPSAAELNNAGSGPPAASTRSAKKRRAVTPSTFAVPTTPASQPTTTWSTPSSPGSSKGGGPGGWAHAPTRWTLLWLCLSLPLVTWDTLYIFGRPHTMEGGWLHWPMWVPYKLYGSVDYVYGWPAIHENNGFTAAQASLNVCESALYLAYAWAFWSRGVPVGKAVGGVVPRVVIPGRAGSLAVLVGFSAAVMTFSKTVLYWAIELFNGYASIGHNDFATLLFIWIIPNGLWFIGSGYMIASLGGDILKGLDAASAHAKTA